MHTGETTMSTVRRPSAHRAYLREVSRQTTVLHLQGFLFFGTITRVEETIRALVTEPVWVRAPIRFLVLDFALVLGVDLSAAEAFVRVQRLLSGRNVALVICGAGDGKVRRALESVGLLDLPDVEFFITFNDAMECEFTSPASQALSTNIGANPSRRDGERVSARLVRFEQFGDEGCL